MIRINQQNTKITADLLVRFALCLYFIISIFEPYLNGILGSVTKYYMFFVMFVLLWRDGFRLKVRRISWIYIIWVVYKIATLLWTEDFRTPRLHFISQVGMVMYLVILLSAVQNRKTLDSIKDIYWLSSIVLGVLSIFFSGAYRGTAEARQVLFIMGVGVDPNNQAALLLVGIAISASNILYEKRRIVPSVIGILVNAYGCFNTSSRAALVTLLALAVCCVFYVPEKMKARAVVNRMLIMGLAGVALYFLAVTFLPKANFDRMFDFDSYEDGSGRTYLWSITWDVYTKDPLSVLIGAGWGTATLYLNGMGIHNTFLAMLCNVGLFGTLLYMIPIIVIAIKLLRRKQPMPVLLLGAQFIPAFFIEAINKRFFWNAILILFMYYLKDQKDARQMEIMQ